MNRILILFPALFYSQLAFAQFNDSINHRFSFATTGVVNKTKETSSFVLNNVAG